MLRSLSLRERAGFMQGNILVLTVTRALGMLSRSMAFPYTSLYILALGGNPEQIGLITALSPLAGLLVFPVGGHLADRSGRVKLVALGGYLSSAILVLYVVAPNWQVLALGTLLRGFMVFQFPATSAIIADSLTPENRGKGVATMNTISGAVALAAPYIAGTVLESYGDELGMRVLYGVMTVIYLLNAVISHRFLQESTPAPDATPATHAGSGRTTLWDAFKEGVYGLPSMMRSLPASCRALAVIVTLAFVANAVAAPYWVVYALDDVGLSTSAWGAILLVEMLVRNAIAIPAGMAVDRHGRAPFIRGALLVTAIAVPLFALASGFVHVLLIRIAIGIANAFFLPACSAMMADTVPRDVRGRAMAALGRGTVLLGASSGGTGGPGLGFLVTIPVMVGSLLGGYLYSLTPLASWLSVLAATGIALVVAATALHDAACAEV